MKPKRLEPKLPCLGDDKKRCSDAREVAELFEYDASLFAHSKTTALEIEAINQFNFTQMASSILRQ